MTPFFAKYGYHPQTEWLKEPEARNPRVNLYAHCVQTIYQQARQSLERTRKAMGHYYEQKAKQQPNLKVGYMIMLNVQNIRTKPPSKMLASKLYSLFKILEHRGELAYKLELSEGWKIHPVWHLLLLKPYPTSI